MNAWNKALARLAEKSNTKADRSSIPKEFLGPFEKTLVHRGVFLAAKRREFFREARCECIHFLKQLDRNAAEDIKPSAARAVF